MRLDLIFTMRNIYINANLDALAKLTVAEYRVERYPPMAYLSNDHEGRPNQHENSHMLYSEKGNPFEFDE